MPKNPPSEADLCDVVVAKLRAMGWKVVCEIPFFYRRIDIVALHGKRLICVEVKTSFTPRLLHQARSCQITADEVYCAIGSNATHAVKNQLLNTGIGLWQVVGTEIIGHAHSYPRDPDQYFRAKLLAKVASASETTRGGLPCGPESGYLRGIAADVEAFKQENPKATWRQIYEAIKSPYSSSANLYSALRKHDVRERRKEARKNNAI